MKKAILIGMLLTVTSCAYEQRSAGNAAPDTTDLVSSSPSTSLQVPIFYRTLENGLKVVISEEHTAPVTAIGVYYNIGFRIEPKNRTGFAHLFEHMMFQGSTNLPKGEFDKLVNGNGGVNNGSTRFDFTNYYEIVPSHTTETFVWVESDRMSGLNISDAELKNQQGVVKNEVKVNVINQPYGGFPWLDLPQTAFSNWYNAHNFYGDLDDLDAASLDDVNTFFDEYYAPNNAVLVITGDVDVAQTFEWVKRYFSDIPAGKKVALPDVSEPAQRAPRYGSRVDPLAPKPAYAIGFRIPPRNSPEYFAMGLIDQILLQGDDSWLYQALIEQQNMGSGIYGGVNLLGSMFNYKGPMLWSASMIHDESVSGQAITLAVNDVIKRLQDSPVSEAELTRAKTKMRSSLYSMIEEDFGVGKIDLLACFALFDDNPEKINSLEAEFAKVTPALIQRTAKQWLVENNSTVFTISPTSDDAAREGE